MMVSLEAEDRDVLNKAASSLRRRLLNEQDVADAAEAAARGSDKLLHNNSAYLRSFKHDLQGLMAKAREFEDGTSDFSQIVDGLRGAHIGCKCHSNRLETGRLLRLVYGPTVFTQSNALIGPAESIREGKDADVFAVRWNNLFRVLFTKCENEGTHSEGSDSERSQSERIHKEGSQSEGRSEKVRAIGLQFECPSRSTEEWSTQDWASACPVDEATLTEEVKEMEKQYILEIERAASLYKDEAFALREAKNRFEERNLYTSFLACKQAQTVINRTLHECGGLQANGVSLMKSAGKLRTARSIYTF